MAISLEGNTFDPTLVKPKCVWKLYISCAKIYFLKKLEKKKLFCKSITPTWRLWKLGWRKESFMEFLYKLYANSCFCRKKCIFLKRILALPMLGQIRTVSELQPFTFDTFDLGHPVHKWNVYSRYFRRSIIYRFFNKTKSNSVPVGKANLTAFTTMKSLASCEDLCSIF